MVTESAPNDGRIEAVEATKHIGLLVVHHLVLFRQGLRVLVGEETDIEIVADAGAVSEAVRLDVTPDVIVVDSVLADAGEENLVRTLGNRFDAVPIIVVGPAERFNVVRAVIAIGGMGYITEMATFDELVYAVRSVAHGQPFLQSSIGVALARWDTDRSRSAEQLSSKECEVLRWIALGYTNREIATLLGTSIRTVESQRASIVLKLGFGDRVGLVQYAHRTGLVDFT